MSVWAIADLVGGRGGWRWSDCRFCGAVSGGAIADFSGGRAGGAIGAGGAVYSAVVQVRFFLFVFFSVFPLYNI